MNFAWKNDFTFIIDEIIINIQSRFYIIYKKAMIIFVKFLRFVELKRS